MPPREGPKGREQNAEWLPLGSDGKPATVTALRSILFDGRGHEPTKLGIEGGGKAAHQGVEGCARDEQREHKPDAEEASPAEEKQDDQQRKAGTYDSEPDPVGGDTRNDGSEVGEVKPQAGPEKQDRGEARSHHHGQPATTGLLGTRGGAQRVEGHQNG